MTENNQPSNNQFGKSDIPPAWEALTKLDFTRPDDIIREDVIRITGWSPFIAQQYISHMKGKTTGDVFP